MDNWSFSRYRAVSIDVFVIAVYWLLETETASSLALMSLHFVIAGVIIFALLGRSVASVTLPRSPSNAGSLQRIFLLNVSVGLVAFFLISLTLSVMFSLTAYLMMMIVSAAIITCDALDILVMSQNPPPLTGPKAKLALPVILVITVSALVAVLFRHNFSWPSMPGWDLYAHLSDSNWILVHGGISNPFPPAPGSLPYSYLFYVLVAAFSLAAGTSPYTVFWIGPFFSIPLYGILVFALAITLTRNRIQSIFAAVIAVTISGGDILLGPQYFFPSTAFVLLFLLGCLVLLSPQLRGRRHTLLWVSIFAISFLIYYYAFFVCLPLVAILYMQRFPESPLSKRWWTIFSSSLVLGLFFTTIGSTFLGSDNLSLFQRVSIFQGVYSDALLLLFIVGSFVILVDHYSKRPPSPIMLALLLYGLAMIIFVVVPVPFSYRADVALRPFFSMVASFSVVFIVRVSGLSTSSPRDGSTPKRGTGWLAVLFVTSFLLLSSVFLIQPYWNYSQQEPSYSNISADEYNAALWLHQNAPQGAYILTDPSTGYVLRGLTLLNCSTSFIIDGQAVSPWSNENLTLTIYGFFSDQNLTTVSNYLDELPAYPTYIVLTTRTGAWIMNGNPNSVFPAPVGNTLVPFTGSQKFSTTLFSVAATWNSVEILRLNGG